MKKILILIALLLIPCMAFAEGTVTVTKDTINGGDVEIVKFSFIANASGTATVPLTNSTDVYPGDKAGYIIKVVTDPGACAACPTDNYNITLIDTVTGADLMGGELSNLKRSPRQK
jgi:hypothetical protein